MKPMKSREFNIIDQYFSIGESREGILGIGDDCSALPIHKRGNLLTTTDHMVEGVHFLKEKITPWQLGWKSLAVSLSDIAAMGGHPQGAFLNLALPKNISSEFLKEFSVGFFSLAKSFNVPLLGGDTTASPGPIFVGTTLLGQVDESNMKTRKGAQIEDEIVVCGPVGDSHIGLSIVLDKLPKAEGCDYFLKKHLQPKPLVEEGIWLGEQNSVHGMMDLSDGLVSDLGHLTQASNLGAEVIMENIPTSKNAEEFIKKFSLDRHSVLLEGGEDYGLLLAVSSDDYENLKTKFENKFNLSFISIGKFTKSNELKFTEKGKALKTPRGFRHF